MSNIDDLINKGSHAEAYNLLMETYDKAKDDENWNRAMVICGYYVNVNTNGKYEARRAMNRIMFENNWNRDICLANIHWYTTDIRQYATLINFSNEALSEFSEVVMGDMRRSYFPSNPTIYKHDDGFVANIRFVSYYLNDGSYIQTSSDKTINTENALVFYDRNMIERRRVKINDIREKYYTYIRGIEDIRITGYDKHNDTVNIIGTVVDYQPIYERVMPKMIIATIDCKSGNIISYYIPQVKNEGTCEKNWVPIVDKTDCNNEYVYMYHNRAIEVVIPNADMFISKSVSQELNLSGLRCSSQVIKGPNNKYYTVTHEVYSLSREESHKRRYIHRFLELDSEFKALRCSSPFKYSVEGIQYIAGLCYDDHNNRFIITGSVNDRDARMYSITWDNIDKMLDLVL